MGDSDAQPVTPEFAFLAVVPPGAPFPFPRMLSSLRAQSKGNWKLYVVGGTAQNVSIADQRIEFLASHAGLADSFDSVLAIMHSPFLTIIEQDGDLEEAAVEHFTEAATSSIAGPPDILYANESVKAGPRRRVHFKPDFSPERLRSQFYLGNCVFYRADLIREIGGLNGNLVGAELYDLALRIAQTDPIVVHIRDAVFDRDAGQSEPGVIHGDVAIASTRAALQAHLDATGGGWIESISESGIHRTHRPVLGSPLVSIIIPTRGSVGRVHGKDRRLVLDCVKSIVEKTTYENYEVVVVIDTVADQTVASELEKILGGRLRLVWWDLPFNFSAKMNRGVFHSRGEFVLFLNDDTEVISNGWVEAMLSLAQLPNAGMAGAMLYFEDESIQHAGHTYEAGDAGHAGTNDRRGSRGPWGSYLVEREISGVTAACAMMPREIFDEVGGFSLLLPGNFNDVDLCLKVGLLGHAIYWTPYSELYHYESKTRISRVARYEVETAWGRWEWRLDDPAYWPYGSLKSAD